MCLSWKTTAKKDLITSNTKKEEYLKAVEDVIHYITEGDIYIANLTQQLCINSSRPPYEVFKRLRTNNPSPFGGYFNYGNFQIISASPERNDLNRVCIPGSVRLHGLSDSGRKLRL